MKGRIITETATWRYILQPTKHGKLRCRTFYF